MWTGGYIQMRNRIKNLRYMKMKIEKIFRKIPDFQGSVLDTILFEGKYPVLFTCKNDKDIYLFICYIANAQKIGWIGTKTTYENLIDLFENRITIRNAFLNITNSKFMIEYDGEEVQYNLKNLMRYQKIFCQQQVNIWMQRKMNIEKNLLNSKKDIQIRSMLLNYELTAFCLLNIKVSEF